MSTSDNDFFIDKDAKRNTDSIKKETVRLPDDRIPDEIHLQASELAKAFLSFPPKPQAQKERKPRLILLTNSQMRITSIYCR